MASLRLLPMVDDWGPPSNIVLRHGERGDMDPAHPEACLCGEPYYLHCEAYLNDDDGFMSMEFKAAPPDLRSV